MALFITAMSLHNRDVKHIFIYKRVIVKYFNKIKGKYADI